MDGSLHEVTALSLAAQVLTALKERNGLDTALVDDVVLGCVDPVGEAGGDIARAAALVADMELAGYRVRLVGSSGVQPALLVVLLLVVLLHMIAPVVLVTDMVPLQVPHHHQGMEEVVGLFINNIIIY